MFNMRLWCDNENIEENVVDNIGISSINFVKTTGLYVKNSSYKYMVTNFLLNTVLHQVVFPLIIETKEQLEYYIYKHNPYWLTNGPCYKIYICNKLHGTASEKYTINARTDRYNIICYIDVHEKNSPRVFMTVAIVVIMK